MPLYAYHCATCGRDADQFSKIADRQHGPDCCGAPMVQALTAPMVFVPGDFAYQCQITGEVVQTERKRKYIMEQHNLADARDYKDTWAKKRAKKAEEAAEAKKYYDALPDAVKKAAVA